jgi:hypothetical protein
MSIRLISDLVLLTIAVFPDDSELQGIAKLLKPSVEDAVACYNGQALNIQLDREEIDTVLSIISSPEYRQYFGANTGIPYTSVSLLPYFFVCVLAWQMLIHSMSDGLEPAVVWLAFFQPRGKHIFNA